MNPMRTSRNSETSGDPRTVSAIEELIALVRSQYPEATFDVGKGEDPSGTYIWAVVDVEDTDAVLDVVIDRLLEMQIEKHLPIYLIPTRPRRPTSDQKVVQRKSFDYLFERSGAAR